MKDKRKTSVLKTYGAAVRKRRLLLGISQEELGDLAGLHRTYIGGIERGERNPSLRNIARIAVALRAELFDFFSEPDSK